MQANDVSKGGSFYLQSKFYRANELLQEYIGEQRKKTGTTGPVPLSPEEDLAQQQQTQSTTDENNSQPQK